MPAVVPKSDPSQVKPDEESKPLLAAAAAADGESKRTPARARIAQTQKKRTEVAERTARGVSAACPVCVHRYQFAVNPQIPVCS